MKDKTKLLHERALITCVIMLFLCIILKLFGFQWFNLDTDIPILNKINEIVMNNRIVHLIANYFLFSLNIFMFIGTVNKLQPKECLNNILKFFWLILVCFYIGDKINTIKIVLDMFILIILCCYKSANKMKSFYRLILFSILNMIYQIISLYIRDIGVYIKEYSFVVSIVMMLDYYMLLFITYLLSIQRKENHLWDGRVYFSSLANRLWRKRTTNSKQSLQNKER